MKTMTLRSAITPWASFMTMSEAFIIVKRFAFSAIEKSRASVTNPSSVTLRSNEVMKMPLTVRIKRKYGCFSNDHSIKDRIFIIGFTFSTCSSSVWLMGVYWVRGLIRAAPVTVVTAQMAAYTRITFCVESSRSVTSILMIWGRMRPSTLIAAVQMAMAMPTFCLKYWLTMMMLLVELSATPLPQSTPMPRMR